MKHKDLHYPPLPDFGGLSDALVRYSRLATEFGHDGEADELLRRYTRQARAIVGRS
jgi:hypothetical protein